MSAEASLLQKLFEAAYDGNVAQTARLLQKIDGMSKADAEALEHCGLALYASCQNGRSECVKLRRPVSSS